MIQYDYLKPLYSIHVPKCAGSSFTRVLRRWFRFRLHFHYHDERRDRPPKRARMQSLRGGPRKGMCVHGHFNEDRGEGVFDYYPDAEQLITILRDPFDAHVSNYFYVRRKHVSQQGTFEAGALHPIIENDWSLDDYLTHSPTSFYPLFLPDMSPAACHEIMANRFLYVGVTEHLQLTIDRLAEILDKPAVSVPVENESAWGEPVPAGARERFYADNPVATAAYDYALKSNGLQPRAG